MNGLGGGGINGGGKNGGRARPNIGGPNKKKMILYDNDR
jgi:hypothetical protein